MTNMIFLRKNTTTVWLFKIKALYLGKKKNKQSMTENNSRNICVICGREYIGHGNNADPVADGYCCDKCNCTVVIPLRIRMYENISNNQ